MRNMLANEPTVTRPPKVRISFRKLRLLASTSFSLLCYNSFSGLSKRLFFHSLDETFSFAMEPNLSNKSKPPVNPRMNITRTTVVAVKKSKETGGTELGVEEAEEVEFPIRV